MDLVEFVKSYSTNIACTRYMLSQKAKAIFMPSKAILTIQ